jgi:hypothetical protein
MTALRRAQAEVPHAVIVGSNLPELSPSELVLALRADARTRQVAIVGVHADADARLQHPYTPFDLLATVVEALESRRQVLAGAPIVSVMSSPRSTSTTRNAGRSAKWRLSSGIETL